MLFLRKYLGNSNPAIRLIIGIFLIIIVAVTDYFTSKEISFSIFYLIPISFLTWYSGKVFGVIFSVISSVLWLYMDTEGFVNITNLGTSFWSSVVRFGFFIIVTFLISSLKNLRDNQEEIINQRTLELKNEILEHKKSRDSLLLKSQQLSELNNKIETIKEDQNTRIAREIHDELGQYLTAINLELMWLSKKYSNIPDVVERMFMLSQIITETISVVRRISADLRPRLLDQLGLMHALKSLVKDFRTRTGFNVISDIPEVHIPINEKNKITIYRIFQEALTNIARHSACTDVEVKIIYPYQNSFYMEISDNGKGFSFDNTFKKTDSLGLIGMFERANILNGNLEILTETGKGTKLVLVIPVN